MLKHVQSVTRRNKDGSLKTNWYFRPTKTPIPYHPSDVRHATMWADLLREYESAPVDRVAPGTVANLIKTYRESQEWSILKNKTKIDYNTQLDYFLETIPNANVKDIRKRHLIKLRDKLALEKSKAQADRFVRIAKVLMSFAIAEDIRTDNPADKIRSLHSAEPYRPWTDHEIALITDHGHAQFRLALALALGTGQRISDVVGMQWSAIGDQCQVQVRQEKTGKQMVIPLLPALYRAVRQHQDHQRSEHQSRCARANRRGDPAPPAPRTILASLRSGEPLTDSGVRQEMYKSIKRARAAVDQEIAAGARDPGTLPENFLAVQFHGLRKNAVCALAEAGCTSAEIAAVTGQSLQMVEHYMMEINQRRMAQQAIERLTLRLSSKNGGETL